MAASGLVLSVPSVFLLTDDRLENIHNYGRLLADYLAKRPRLERAVNALKIKISLLKIMFDELQAVVSNKPRCIFLI